MNAIYIVVFFAIYVIIVKVFNLKLLSTTLNLMLRVLLGIVFISFVNYILYFFGAELHVNINEISMTISAVFGISGIIFLFIFQWFLTMM